MAKSDGTVYVDTLIDTKGFGKGVNTMQKQIGGLSGAIGKLGIAIAAAFAVKKLVQFGKEAIDLGSDLQEVQNVVDVVFGNMSEDVNEFAENALEQFGLSEYSAKQYASTLGAMFKSFGFMTQDAKKMSLTLTSLAGDMASFYNLDSADAFAKLRAGISGETEPLKQLGINLSVANLEQFALQKGINKTYNSMSELEKVMLRYNYILYATTQSQGDFARTSDSWANQTRILSETFNEFKRNIGQALINIFTPFLKVINQIVSKMAQLSQHFVAFSEMLVGKSTSGGGGSPGEALEGISDGYSDIADATDEATKAQNKYLTGLDEIKTFSEAGGLEETTGIGSTGFDIANMGKDEELQNSINAIDTLKQKLAELKLQYPILNNVFSILSNGMQVSKEIAVDLFNLLTQPFSDNKDGFLNAANTFATFLKENLETVIVSTDEAMQQFRGVYESEISPVIQELTQDFSKLTEDVLKWFNEDMGPVLDRWGESFTNMWENHVEPVYDQLIDFFANTAKNIDSLWNETLEPFVSWFVTTILPALTPVIEAIGERFINRISSIMDYISAFIQVLNGLITFVTGVFTGDWEKALDGLYQMFFGTINKIVSVFENALNWIIDTINALITGVNSVGGSLGVNISIPKIPKFDIPKLATGAVIPPNAPFMAMLGDQKHGTNIEAPLDTIKQAVREVVGNGNNGGQYAFTAQINRRTLFEEIIDEAKLRQSTTGRNPFDLA